MRGSQRLCRQSRLRSPKDYQRVSRRGARRASSVFVVLSLAQGDSRGGSRLGLTVSRRVGNSVIRSRVKRHIREWFRKRYSGFEKETDIVVIARSKAAALRGAEVEQELDSLVS